jgi:hypothetical protein
MLFTQNGALFYDIFQLFLVNGQGRDARNNMTRRRIGHVKPKIGIIGFFDQLGIVLGILADPILDLKMDGKYSDCFDDHMME